MKASRLLECKHFFFMPGMLVTGNMRFFMPGMLITGNMLPRPYRVLAVDGNTVMAHNADGCDLPVYVSLAMLVNDSADVHVEDPATNGCFQYLIRKAWGPDYTVVFGDGEDPVKVFAHAHFGELVFSSYKTDAAEALVLALEAAP